ncbi:MAG TPA: hypothetical protein VEH80_01285 [Candidatus Bathyarchaeia archaeon]|nr:hypothetical protein [Candidatus Bathyarchaeia archaeon]
MLAPTLHTIDPLELGQGGKQSWTSSNGSVGRTPGAVSTPCDVVSCAGTVSSKLRITTSPMGFNQVVHEGLIEIRFGDGLTRPIHVKMSGRANGRGSITSPRSASTAPR